jgi:diguanylate cyclase (GGDEF)-like protein
MKLLVVDDDAIIVRAVKSLLTFQSHAVDVAMDGQIAWELMQTQIYDLIVLDIVLPKLDGISLCQKLRKEGYAAPILMLTARGSSNDKVTGLDAGADDYIIKPFDWQELLARVRALLRREEALVAPILSWGALSLNPKNCEVRYANNLLTLRPREYRLLELLLRNPDRVFSCGAILEHIWMQGDQPLENTVRSHIKSLRQKLKSVEVEDLIETVYGLGYRFKSDAEGPSTETMPPISHTNISHADAPNELRQAIAAAWEEVKPQLLEKVRTLEDVASVVEAQITSSQRQRAITASHQLAGTVGAYGFKRGSEIARQIENLLRGSPFDSAQFTALKAKVVALRQALGADPKGDRLTSDLPQSLHLNDAASARILAIDADFQVLTILTSVLEPLGLSLTTFSNIEQFWEHLENIVPDLLLLDITFHPNSLVLCKQVRSHPRWAGLPVIFLASYTDTEIVQQVFRSGADDFVMKPIVASDLVHRVVTRIERYRFWQRLIERDPLTQLANRVKFTQDLHRLLHSAPQCVSLVILHIYQLKSLNRQYGYQTGDIVLKQVAVRLSQICEDHLVARWSGNKFAIALQGVTTAEARQQLSAVIESQPINPEGDWLALTVRMGTAQYPKDGQDVQALCRSAEDNLVELLV